MPSRRTFLGGLASLTALSSLAPALAQRTSKPNIVVFLVDDLGYGDFGCYGDTFHETPNIDRLCADGMKFTQNYAGAPVCSPSRAAILTSQAPARLHLTQWLPGTIYPHKRLSEPPIVQHLPLGVQTLASQLRNSGYETAAIGKWHLGGNGYLPENFGFDVNVAGDAHGNPPSYFGPFDFHNLVGYTKHDYLTEVLTGYADRYIEDVAKRGPFFLYMAEYSVHIPLEARQAMIEKYRRKNGGKDEPDPVYAAMVESVDIAFGNLRSLIERLGVADNTIILVTSDNGGLEYQGQSLHEIADNGGLRGGKGFLYEGGIRVPLIAYWPGVTTPGSVCDVPVSGLDILPTLMAIADGAPPADPLDGVDLRPLLRGAGSIDRDALYWHYPHYSDQGGTPSGAIREGDWKLIEFFEGEHLELYNLALDPGEQYDFSSSFDGKARKMQAKLKAWRQSVHADLPRSNPNYNPILANVPDGPVGCSWIPSNTCLED